MKKRMSLMPILMAIMMVFTVMPMIGGAVHADEGIIDQGSCGEELGWQYYGSGDLRVGGLGTTMDDYDWPLARWYDYRENITKIYFDAKNIQHIGDNAFTNLDNVTSVKLPNSVKSIGMGAFKGTSGLTSITIPSNVESIGNGAFCFSGLQSVEFASGSKLKTIDNEAFKGCNKLSVISIPDGVETIVRGAFRECENLKEVTIPASVTSIGNEVFKLSNNLKTINYLGSRSQWQTLTNGVDLKAPAGVKVRYPNYTKQVKFYPSGYDYFAKFTYDGKEHTCDVDEGLEYTLTGTTKATNAGIYTVTATLKTDSDSDYVYEWTDGTTDPKTLEWRIFQATVLLNVPEGKNLIYNGKTQTGVEAGTGYTLSGTASAVNAGTYTATASLNIDPNYLYKWTVEYQPYFAKTITWTINKATAPVTVPEGKDLTYNGEEQTGVDEGIGYTLTGETKATDAGTYYATATLRTDDPNYTYEWEDGETGPRTIEWKIGKATAKATVPEGKDLTYNGEEQTGVDEGTGYILSGKTKATDAGTYTAEATLVTDDPIYTYEWADGETGPRTIEWKIDKATAKVTPPATKTFTYNGKEQVYAMDGANYTLSGTTKATNAGTYTAKATLNEHSDPNYEYVWEDGKTSPKEITWTINKATAKVTQPTGKKYTYNGKAKTGVAAGSNYTLTGTVTATKAGTYTATAKLKTNANYTYKWSDGTTAAKTIKWTINKAGNPLKIKAKTATVKYSKLKKKNQTLAVGKVITFSKKGQGKMTYTKASGNKKITISKTTGKVTVKKGLKKGTYKVKVKVKAAGNANYKASAVKTVTFKVKVK